MAAADVLDVKHLTIQFGATRIVSDLSFQVERGTTLAIIGPNGAGKTVLFRALIGAIPFDGEIRWQPDTRMGYVPQKLDLERDLPITGADFLRARAALAGVSVVEVSRALELVGIAESVARQPIGMLSGGQFQRLLIASALVGDPNVLLLDEPMASVDEPGQEQLNLLVARLQRERQLTVLFISHELSVVYRHASNVLCLNRSKAWLGLPRTILTPDLLHEMYGTDIHFHIHDA
jgi:zinc transport system ATP-binding protein